MTPDETRMRIVIALALLLAACGAEGAREGAPCPERAPAPDPLPRTQPEHARLEHWLARETPASLDRVLMSVDRIAAHERALAERGRGGRGGDALLDVPEQDAITATIRERLGALEDDARAGRLVAPDGSRLSLEALRVLVPPPVLPPLRSEIRVALARVPIRCSPHRGALVSGDPRFDRNLCSTLQPQEPVQVLLRWPNGALLARTPYVMGWIDGDAALSPVLADDDARALLSAPRVVARGAIEGARECVLPADGDQLVVATRDGLERVARTDGAFDVRRPLTRRAFLEAAFAHLGEPYGWGGDRDGCDCSQLAQEVFATFGIHLPRNSAVQAHAGTSAIELDATQDDAERTRLLDDASRRGVVLLAFPGHVMLYLGRSREGRPMVLHALAEYVEPCGPGGETLRVVDRVVVSDLSLGAGSSRRSLLQRTTRLVVFGE